MPTHKKYKSIMHYSFMHKTVT
ncbi:protein of unknown function [Thermococcus camini]|uniref:Uncharacterized protein n=1 Tax=Thermococcus camini TaxID=2016373 RepID=A0A7G2D513_9EURY|nr:protein of unknown function [Thermococcus camini]